MKTARRSAVRAELGEVRGVEGPVRLVALEQDEAVRGVLYRFEDRIFYATARPHTEAEVVTYSDTFLWSSGPCGESPRRIASGRARRGPCLW